MNTWVTERTAQGRAPWSHTVDDHNEALTELLEFMTSRCVLHNNQQSTVRGYRIFTFSKMFAGWELPLTHCINVAVRKGADKAHPMYTKEKACWIALFLKNGNA